MAPGSKRARIAQVQQCLGWPALTSDTTWRENYFHPWIFKGRRERTGPSRGATHEAIPGLRTLVILLSVSCGALPGRAPKPTPDEDEVYETMSLCQLLGDVEANVHPS
ncbi:hypothetical protein DER46DRAFT_654190 [Fusarium sp. MPI-SDFR-AT-0072]|nr:hypothetical protein DER46DRAFT_654190 [Fusarium sp. MPI-SDFR-AT-0072]